MIKRHFMLGADGFGVYEDGKRVDASADTMLVPGFVDIHIHGGNGNDFMSATRQQIVDWCNWLAEQGYEAFLPTTVTASADQVRRALDNLPDHPMIAGFHLEGPFISPVFPGAQPPSWISNSTEGWDDILHDPRLRVITLAPELPGVEGLIRGLSSRGVIVSMGHTNATFAECETAEKAGARHTTHTFNAMRGLHHREAGTVGYALLSDSLSCELIYDRLHVCKDAAQLLFKSKPKDQVIAVSDSTMAAGLPAGTNLRMWDLDAVVGEQQVRLRDGTLAGSAITLLDAFRNLADDFGPEAAIRACCLNPRRALAMPHPKTWLEFDKNFQLLNYCQ